MRVAPRGRGLGWDGTGLAGACGAGASPNAPPSLLLPLPMSLLYTHSLPPYYCPYPCPYCTLPRSLRRRRVAFAGGSACLDQRVVRERLVQHDLKGDETCPVSTGGGTRRVQSVREGGGGQEHDRQQHGGALASDNQSAARVRHVPRRARNLDGPASDQERDQAAAAAVAGAEAAAARRAASAARRKVCSRFAHSGREERKTATVQIISKLRRVRGAGADRIVQDASGVPERTSATWGRPVASRRPPPPLVLSGHAASLTPY